MKAVRIHEYGGSTVLRYEDAPIPTCASDEVLIRVIGSSVNPVPNARLSLATSGNMVPTGAILLRGDR